MLESYSYERGSALSLGFLMWDPGPRKGNPPQHSGAADRGLMCSLASSSAQSSRHSKLEKADILEMTVKHLRNLQRAQMTGKDGSRVPLCGRPPRPAVISSRLPPAVVSGIQLHFTALAHSRVPTVWDLFIATTPSCYCSGKGGREVVAVRVAGAWLWRKPTGAKGFRTVEVLS